MESTPQLGSVQQNHEDTNHIYQDFAREFVALSFEPSPSTSPGSVSTRKTIAGLVPYPCFAAGENVASLGLRLK